MAHTSALSDNISSDSLGGLSLTNGTDSSLSDAPFFHSRTGERLASLSEVYLCERVSELREHIA